MIESSKARVFVREGSFVNKALLKRMNKAVMNGLEYETTIIDDEILEQAHKVAQWQCSSLKFISKYQLNWNPLTMIRNINFQQLKVIVCCRNSLQSIEGLARLRAPFLQELILSKYIYILQISLLVYLYSQLKMIIKPNLISNGGKPFLGWENYISEIGQLKKMESQRLNYLNINANLIKEGDCLTTTHWKNLDQIIIEPFLYGDGTNVVGLILPYEKHKTQINSLAFIAKLKLQQAQMNYIHFYSRDRIPDNEILKAIRRKSNRITMYTRTRI